jgi:hypothetical protein
MIRYEILFERNRLDGLSSFFVTIGGVPASDLLDPARKQDEVIVIVCMPRNVEW